MIGNLQFQLLALALLRISEAGLLQQCLPDPNNFEQQLETYTHMYYWCSRKWFIICFNFKQGANIFKQKGKHFLSTACAKFAKQKKFEKPLIKSGFSSLILCQAATIVH